jgi:putative ATP-dependent endonuclease of OLD family
MPEIRHLRIEQFRGIAQMEWVPKAGINAIVGPGDAAKSTILDAIEVVLSRRGGPFTEVDFTDLDTTKPIVIDLTVGDLPPPLTDIELYGSALRGWLDAFDSIYDEPGPDLEPVLTLRFRMDGQFEPSWSLYSERLEQAGLPRDIRSADRGLLAFLRLGVSVAPHLAWSSRSVLSQISGGRIDTVGMLAKATRVAREEFNASATTELQKGIDAARAVAREMAVAGALQATAGLDARAVSMANGAVALHNSAGVPLRSLGTGSSRLLAAGLQARAAEQVSILLLDEAEYGLEPHRITRLMHRLASTAAGRAPQVFLTTHSPAVLRELSEEQLWITRRTPAGTVTLQDPAPADAQGLLRSCAEAFFAQAVVVCEGATEIGLVRGLDLWRTQSGGHGLALLGVAVADGNGDNMWRRATGFAKLGCPTALLRDADKPAPNAEQAFVAAGGSVLMWDDGLSTEQQLFRSLPVDLLPPLIAIADEHKTPARVDDHLRSQGVKAADLAAWRSTPSDSMRETLGVAAKSGEWFKRIDVAEVVGQTIVGPNLGRCTDKLLETLLALHSWIVSVDPSGDDDF